MMKRAMTEDDICEQLAGSILEMKPFHAASSLMLLAKASHASYDCLACIRDCPAETLKAAFDTVRAAPRDDDANATLMRYCLELASHPNFPWDKYSLCLLT